MKTLSTNFSRSIGVLIFVMAAACLISCRRTEPKNVPFSHVLDKSSLVVFAEGRWLSDLEIEVVVKDWLPVKRGVAIKSPPTAGKVLDVLKFSEHPVVPPESFVAFFRSSDSGIEIVGIFPVLRGRIPLADDMSGVDITVTDLRNRLLLENK